MGKTLDDKILAVAGKSTKSAKISPPPKCALYSSSLKSCVLLVTCVVMICRYVALSTRAAFGHIRILGKSHNYAHVTTITYMHTCTQLHTYIHMVHVYTYILYTI